MTDSEFGEIQTRTNARARGFTFRFSEGHLLVTVPQRWSERELAESIERMRPKLRNLMQRIAAKPYNRVERHIDWNFRIETECFSFRLLADETLRDRQCRLQKDRGHVTLCCPPDFDFMADGAQTWLVKVVEEQVRSYAKGMLPARLRALADEFKLPFNEVHINSAHGRWGSCSRKVRHVLGVTLADAGYNINLSLYLLLLPERLQRLVMLHELTHTLEMNHSPRFHAKLDAMLGGEEAALEKELKRYTTDIFSFAAQ